MRTNADRRRVPSATLAALLATCLATGGAHAGTLADKKRLELAAAARASVPRAKEGEDRTLSPYFFVLSENPDTDRLPLKSTRADVSISGVIADVKVTQVYRNDGASTIEAIYIFPLSTRAAVHAMRMTVGRRVIEAVIDERAKARRTYEKARGDGRTASLMEQERPNVFEMSVANILPGDEVAVELSYAELLVPDAGVYGLVYPAVVGPRYSNREAAGAPDAEAWVENPYLHAGAAPPYGFEVHARIEGGMPLARVWSPSHQIDVSFKSLSEAEVTATGGGTRDFVLDYSLAGGSIEGGLLVYPGEDESFFLAMIEPPARVEPKAVSPREYVFILDVSGSMHGFPLDTSKALVRDVLLGLNPKDAFNILTFSGGSDVLAERSLPATPENVRRGVAWVDGQEGGGGTELLPALERALDLPGNAGASRIVVVATDGYVAVEKEAFELVRERLGEASLFPFGIGTSVNRALIEGLARCGMGEPFVVQGPAQAAATASRFRAYVSSPVLTRVRVAYEGFAAYDVEPKSVPDVFASRPVIVFGKLKGRPEGRIRVSGTTPAGPWSKVIEARDADASGANRVLRYLWARHRIASLADDNLLEKDDARAKAVTALGLKYGLMTDTTSFVAVDTVVRADGKTIRTVRQPLPLPDGVSDLAVGDSRGYGGLGLSGTGRGGGGTAYGIGLGSISTCGYGRGTAAAPRAVSAAAVVTGSLSREVIRKVIQRHMKAVRACYEAALQANPALAGRMVVKLVIEGPGRVRSAIVAETTLNDAAVEACVVKVFAALVFPRIPGGGEATVNYPVELQPK
jgi:Ca-activated chloride channel homolog